MNATVSATTTRLEDRWARSLRATLPGSGPQWLQALRVVAAEEFLRSGLPGNKDEAWKYTSLRQLENLRPELGIEPVNGKDVAWRSPLLAGKSFGHRVHNGRMEGFDGKPPPGVTMVRLEQALSESPSPLLDRLRSLLENVDARRRGRSFEALNTAMLERGVLLHVAPGVDAGQYLAQWTLGGNGPSRMENFRLILLLEAGARLSLVEHYQGLYESTGQDGNAAHALNMVLQFELAPGAALDHVMLQSETGQNVLLSSGEVTQGAGSSYHFTGFDLGGCLVRHAITCRLAGAGASTRLNGAFLANGSSHVDYHVCVEHQAPDCSSEQFFRGVLGGHGRGVFNGKALIQRGADGSKVRQSNANLLLSAFAEIDTKPELEIHADEVEASHGATVGQLDEQAVFYMRSRGLDEAEARRMLTSAFCYTVTDRLSDTALAAKINRMLEAAMPQSGPSANQEP